MIASRSKTTEQSRGPNPKRIRFNAGTAQGASGASFAAELRIWFYTRQSVFVRQKDFADELEVSEETLQDWLGGKVFPEDPHCDRLYQRTELECFSPSGRIVARREHNAKKGLSRAAIKKREKRQYLSAEELAQCQADPEKAFTIRGDDWVACLECGQLLQHIREFHLSRHDGMTAANYRIGPDQSHPRYGPRRGLICNALASKKAQTAAANKNFRYDGTENLRRPGKGRKMPPEFSRKQSARMRGTRNPKWSKGIADIAFVWPWLMEGKRVDEIAKEVARISPDLKFTAGGVWKNLKAIVGLPVKSELVPEQSAIEKAIRVCLDCGGDNVKLKPALAKLCEESRSEVASRTKGLPTRAAMMWFPSIRSWLPGNQSRSTMSGDLARMFLAERLSTRRNQKRMRRRATTKRGPAPKPAEEKIWFTEGAKVERLIAAHGQAKARHMVADESHREYSTVEQYHKKYRRWLKSQPE